MDRAACLKRWQASSAAGVPIVGCGAGTGISAKCAEAAEAETEGGFSHWVAQPYVRPLPAEHKTQTEGIVSALSFLSKMLLADGSRASGSPAMVAKRLHSGRIPDPEDDDDEVKRVRHGDAGLPAPAAVLGVA